MRQFFAVFSFVRCVAMHNGNAAIRANSPGGRFTTLFKLEEKSLSVRSTDPSRCHVSRASADNVGG